MTVKYEGRIPKTLRAYAEKHTHQIQEVTWSSGYSSDTGFAYDAFLRAGWRKNDDYVHTLIDETAAGLISQLRGIVPCDCDECSKEVVKVWDDEQRERLTKLVGRIEAAEVKRG